MRNDYGNKPRAKMMGGGAMMKKPMMIPVRINSGVMVSVRRALV